MSGSYAILFLTMVCCLIFFYLRCKFPRRMLSGSLLVLFQGLRGADSPASSRLRLYRRSHSNCLFHPSLHLSPLFRWLFPMPFSLSGISPSFKLSPSGCHALSGFLLQYARYLSRYGSSILFIIIHAKRNTDCPMLIIVRNADCLDHM